VDKSSGNCLAGSKDKVIIDHDGVKVGFIGLVEEEWITTLAFDTSTIAYKDFVSEGNRLAAELRADGAQLVVVLSHMRVPNDEKLASEVKGVDVILGGHDHFPHANASAPTPLFKSGTDFRWLSKVAVTLPAEGNTASEKGKVDYELITVPRDIAPDAEGNALVDKYAADMQSKLGKVLAECNIILDATAATCRTQESNVGNFICDIMRREYDADCCLLNSGTIRSDATYGPGPFTIRGTQSRFVSVHFSILMLYRLRFRFVEHSSFRGCLRCYPLVRQGCHGCS
jgi:5'-nucleotidase